MINFNTHLPLILSRALSLPHKQPSILILQVTQNHLSQIIPFQLSLQKSLPKHIQTFILCDTNKSPCCTDIIGALHLGSYDLLVHFGEACFSQEMDERHMYCYEEPREIVEKERLEKQIEEMKIDTLMVHQSMIGMVEAAVGENSFLQILKLPPDSHNLNYFALGYYMTRTPNSILMIGFTEEEQQKLALIKESLKVKVFTARTSSEIQLSPRTLMKRLFLINRIKQYSTFGILVKNANTKYCQNAIDFCKQLLSSHQKKSYIFMMNNLNEIKLANFPQIEVYVIISCQNCLLYNESDMHKLVVTPFDLGLALSDKTAHYQFDLNTLDIEDYLTEEMKQLIEEERKVETEKGLVRQETQLQVKQIFQTLQYYSERGYKGIDYSFEKQIKKMSKGKVGLAEEYRKIQ